MNNTLEAGAEGAGLRGSLERRPVVHAEVADFVRAQASVPPRSRIARLLGADPLTDFTWPLYERAIGIMRTGRELDELDGSWTVQEAIVVRASNVVINHLVIGPGGIFAVTTADHSDQSVWVARASFRVEASAHNHIRNSEQGVGCVERLLEVALGHPVSAAGIIVTPDPSRVVDDGIRRDVTVVRGRKLVDFLRAQPSRLTAAERERMSAAAMNPATWAALPEGASAASAGVPGRDDADPLDVLRDFDLVRRTVRHARTTRRLWVIAVFSVLAGVFALTAWALMMTSLAGGLTSGN